MKCIVTAGEGFIGHWLCIELEKRGHTVISLDNNIRGGGASIQFGGGHISIGHYHSDALDSVGRKLCYGC